ncbi:hypothetical protein E4K72_19820 [Oxalobacteraceae bacterium OM1]|nr:hypothetical protein E4K72_19820 [Oxalobacteraceae bacterium OM1]
MEIEAIAKIVANAGYVSLVLRSGGKPSYQHVYRGAKGVRWNPADGSFEFQGGAQWSAERSVRHVMGVLRDEIGIEGVLDAEKIWICVPTAE